MLRKIFVTLILMTIVLASSVFVSAEEIGSIKAEKTNGEIATDVETQKVKFVFNPPDGISYIRMSKMTKVTDMGELGKRTDVTEFKTRVSIKKTSTGYSIVDTPISATMTRDGKEVDSPVLSVLQEVVITYELDTNGQLVSIKGFETLLEKMKQTLPPEVFQSLSTVLNEEAMSSKETAEWNGRIGNFIGREAKVGEVWTSTDEYALPTGEIITYYSATKFAELTTFDGHDCVHIIFSYDSNASALAESLGKTLSDIYEDIGIPSEVKPEISNVAISGGGERLIDPMTMLIYSETVTRTVKMPMEFPKIGKIIVTSDEKMEYNFDYHIQTPTPAVIETPTPEKGVPGFKAVFAIAGLLAVAFLLRRRK